MLSLLAIITLSPNQCVVHYLTASYLYYKNDISIMEDSTYDKLCVRLTEEWDKITHPHKDIIKREEDGSIGSGFNITDYPKILADNAFEYCRKCADGSAEEGILGRAYIKDKNK